MSMLNMLGQLGLDKLNSEKMEKKSSRRELFNFFGDAGKVIAGASVPMALIALSTTKASARNTGMNDAILDTLNFALKLEYLEQDFYNTGLGTNGLIPTGKDFDVITQIARHENAHVSYLHDAITANGGVPIAKPTFDFTASGTFSDVFSNYQTFIALAQAFEDTGVRAYKGGATALQANDAILTAALQIHSVEARHASEIRRIRGEKGWITQNNRGTLPPQAQGVYDGENNVIQGGTNLTTAFSTTSSDAITEAFDEPLDSTSVLAIANLFIHH